MIKERSSTDGARVLGAILENFAKFMTEHRFTVVPIPWKHSFKRNYEGNKVGKEFDAQRKEKLPSAAALDALPEIFRSATEPKDIVVTSITAIMLSEGQLKGSFKGFKNRDTVFEFRDGRKWKQAVYKYQYHYAYMPRAKVIQEGGRYVLHVEGMGESVEVRRA